MVWLMVFNATFNNISVIFDFSGKYPFEKPWNGLTKELKGMGKLGDSIEKKQGKINGVQANI
jgi:hypothetical protein